MAARTYRATHTATMVGVDARTPRDYSARVRLRETKIYWVQLNRDGTNGRYFKKRGGYTPGDWPMFKIELDSIKEIPDGEET